MQDTSKKILYLDMDNVLVDFKSSYVKVSADLLTKFNGHEEQIEHIYSLMDPMPGAIESFNELVDYFDIYILSASPWDNESAWTDKLRWVKKHLGLKARKKLILTHHKNLNFGDFLVDDRLLNGVSGFQGEHIHFGTEKFPNWDSVKNYLKTKI